MFFKHHFEDHLTCWNNSPHSISKTAQSWIILQYPTATKRRAFLQEDRTMHITHLRLHEPEQPDGTAYSKLQPSQPILPPLPQTPPSIPLPRRLRRRTATRTPLIPAPHPQPLLRTQLQLPLQLRARLLAMNEIAKPASHTPFAAVQPAARFSEIRDGRQLAVDGARRVPAGVERVAGALRAVFVFEACVHVADEVCVGGGECVNSSFF